MAQQLRLMSSVALGLLWLSGQALGEELNARGRKEMQKIREVVEENFAASNREDVKGVVNTHTPYSPNMAAFREELKKFFDETDCYTRLVTIRLVRAGDNGQSVIVTVVQETIVSEKDAEEGSDFRTNSAMLPPWPVCAYEMEFHKVRGKWLIFKNISEPREVTKKMLESEDGLRPLTD